VEPDNAELLHHHTLCQRLRAQHQPTLPSTIALERQINPFLRTCLPAVANAARSVDTSIDPTDAVAVLAALREWKNKF
ncbi:MAG: hydroxyacylglutathione hydrolase C-terminal domain-containing protein, partial [Simplicispira sp.]|nr:hydroxyacylglutathione hydrolase C-terminal domain-containing protein [Simplicispira sp.]